MQKKKKKPLPVVCGGEALIGISSTFSRGKDAFYDNVFVSSYQCSTDPFLYFHVIYHLFLKSSQQMLLWKCSTLQVFTVRGEKKVFFRTGNWMLVAEGRVEEEK